MIDLRLIRNWLVFVKKDEYNCIFLGFFGIDWKNFFVCFVVVVKVWEGVIGGEYIVKEWKSIVFGSVVCWSVIG